MRHLECPINSLKNSSLRLWWVRDRQKAHDRNKEVTKDLCGQVKRNLMKWGWSRRMDPEIMTLP